VSLEPAEAAPVLEARPPNSASIAPRFIRVRDAPAYLGMDRNRFNREVRPLLACIPIGIQGVAFDRLDLDRWETKGRRVSQNAVGFGISTSSSEASAFGRALQQATSLKR
jgi:hypothetical protein